MDVFDKAQEADANHRNQALAMQLAAGKQTGPGSAACRECGVKIPKKRREAVPGCSLCVNCQAVEEGCGFDID